MAGEKDALDPRISLLADLFAQRGMAGSVTFPDGLVFTSATVPLAPRSPGDDKQLTPEELALHERREHYAMQLGRPVSDDELRALP